MTISGTTSTSYFSVFSSSSDGSMIYSTDSTFYLTISNAEIQCYSSYSSTSVQSALAD